MSELSTLCNYKKKDYWSVYEKPIRFSCPFCTNTGKNKVFKNLLRLKRHFHREHLWDFDCQRIVADMENYIKIGVLRE
tara:strand:+ start:921 stop:1154 length:234 start_codon:yes stop_codon:yes gene_type:complete